MLGSLGPVARTRRVTRGSPLTLFSLVLASGSIYALPYLRQTYHTTMLEAYGLTNTQLGVLQATFGLTALFCYLPGGKVADRFPARKLLSLSLVLTAIGGGLVLLSSRWPILIGVNAFWGVCTILTFWPALIKATRVWAGEENQGSAFGLLQGFTALVLASLTGVGVAAFSRYADPVLGLKTVIAIYSVANLLAAVAVWKFCPVENERPKADEEETGYLEVSKMRAVQLQAVVILTAYLASWGTADFAAYAEHGFGQSRVRGASLSNFSLWLNPLAAMVAGWMADRVGSSRVIQVGFLASTLSLIVFGLTPASPHRVWFLWMGACVVSLSTFAVMGVYYALLDEGGVPLEATGRAVGIVSIIGYTPDVFAPLLHGWLLDSLPGADGHRAFYLILAGATVVGLTAARAYPSVENPIASQPSR